MAGMSCCFLLSRTKLHCRTDVEVSVGNKRVGKAGAFLYRVEFVGRSRRQHEKCHRAVFELVELLFDPHKLLLTDLAPCSLEGHDYNPLFFGKLRDIDFFAVVCQDLGGEFDI